MTCRPTEGQPCRGHQYEIRSWFAPIYCRLSVDWQMRVPYRNWLGWFLWREVPMDYGHL